MVKMLPIPLAVSAVVFYKAMFFPREDMESKPMEKDTSTYFYTAWWRGGHGTAVAVVINTVTIQTISLLKLYR